MEMDNEFREIRNHTPKVPTTALDTLRHTLFAFRELPDSQRMVNATTGVYGKGVRTGLTLGDLRSLGVTLGIGRDGS